MRVHHIAILAHDVEGLARFYSTLLELPELTRHQDAQGLRSIWLGLEGVILMVERGEGGEGGWHMLSLEIQAERRGSWRRRLQAAGAGPCSQTGFTLYGRDPEGNLFGLSHYPHPAPHSDLSP